MEKKKDRKFNGHKNHACWNVHLWFTNDERLHRIVMSHLDWNIDGKKQYWKSLDEIAKDILFYLHACRDGFTPDGVKYTFSNIRESLKHISAK